MNQKIKELAEQSGVDFSVPIFSDNDKGSEFRHFDVEKFAELIIRECYKIAMKEGNGFYCPSDILDYFGIE